MAVTDQQRTVHHDERMLRTESRPDLHDDSSRPLFVIAAASLTMATIITLTWIAAGMLLVGD